MTTRTYPYTAWVLLPSFKPEQVTLVEKYDSYFYNTLDLTESRKRYDLAELHPTREAAIAVGREKLTNQQQDIDKQIENMKKKQTALDKAEKDAP